MKTVGSTLNTLIHSTNVYNVCDLYEFTRANGDILRYANSDREVTYSSAVWTTVVGFQRAGVKWTAKPEVQSLDITMFVDATVLLGTIPYQKSIVQVAHEGGFDGARVRLFRAFFDSSNVLVDALLHYEGTVADVEPKATSIRFAVKSELDRLNIQLPMNQYQPGCAHAYLSAGCDPSGTLRTASTSTWTLSAATTTTVTIPTTTAADTYKLGVVRMTSGALDGLRRAVRSDVDAGGAHVLTLAVPWPSAPLAGDTISLTNGCARDFATCTAKANVSHFRGFPYVPRPEDTR